MRSSFGSFVVASALLLTVPSLSHALQPEWSEEQLQKMSTHVITGTVVRAYSCEEEDADRVVQRWSIEVRVEKFEKGAAQSAKRVTWLRGWKVVRLKKEIEGGEGVAAPPIGPRIRLYAAEAKDGGLDVVTPNGWSLAPK
jgi:hypothetical protein